MTNKDQSREAFETWLKKHMPHAGLEVDEGQYRSPWEQVAWTGWQAARSTPAAPVTYMPWDNFPSYLIDHCEGDTITEEGLQRALAAMLLDPQYSSADPAAPVELPEPTYTLRVRSVFQDPAPTAQAFGLPDGEYNLYTGQQMRELLEKGGHQPAPNHLQTRMVAQFEAASKSSFEAATDRCLAGLVEQDRRESSIPPGGNAPIDFARYGPDDSEGGTI